MLKRRLAAAVLLALAASAWPQSRETAVQAALGEYIAAHSVVGASVAVLEKDGTLFVSGAGFQDREGKIPATGDTIYRLGSISKPVTAIAAMQMVEAGKLSLFADVRQIVPDWPDKGAFITLRHLLTHTSGIRHYIPLKRDVFYERFSVARSLDVFRSDDLLFKPGERVSYSTHAFSLVARMVEIASGETFAEFVRAHIGKPAGAATLSLENRAVPNQARSMLYTRGTTGDPVRPKQEEDVSWKNGGGGMESSAPDLARFAMAVLRNQLTASPTTDFLFQRQTVDGLDTKRALGWALDADGNPEHSGAQQGCRTSMRIDVRAGRVIVVMTNTDGNHPIADLLKAVSDAWRLGSRERREARGERQEGRRAPTHSQVPAGKPLEPPQRAA